MTTWTETYRGAVPPWQCDVTEHFTIAYYFDRVEEADANLADALGLGEKARRCDIPRRIDARFVRELRAGASFHVESALLSLGAQPGEETLRIGHRFVDSADGGLFGAADNQKLFLNSVSFAVPEASTGSLLVAGLLCARRLRRRHCR